MRDSSAQEIRRALDFRGQQLVHRLVGRFQPRASTRAGIDTLAPFSLDTKDDERPVFLLGAGWRTGSTLLQRMLNAVPDTLIWGEPFSEGALVPHLAESLRFLDPEHGRSYRRELAPAAPVPTEDEWVATLSPTLDNVYFAYRAMLDRLLKEPATDRGCVRWGVKEVVWDKDCLHLLRVLYPHARFVLLVRDPVQQWRSYRPHTRRPWFYRWPDQAIGSPQSFARMWREIVRGFIDADRAFPNVTLTRYEDLSSPEELARLTSFLDLATPLRPALAKVGSSADLRFFAPDVPAWEQFLIRRLTSKGMTHLGYVQFESSSRTA